MFSGLCRMASSNASLEGMGATKTTGDKGAQRPVGDSNRGDTKKSIATEYERVVMSQQKTKGRIGDKRDRESIDQENGEP